MNGHLSKRGCAREIERGELVRVPVEVYWSVAFAPLYQLLKFHLHGRGLSGTPRFVLDEKLMDQTLELVVKALTPPARPLARPPPEPLANHLATHAPPSEDKKALS